jgi:hypothetical protein
MGFWIRTGFVWCKVGLLCTGVDMVMNLRSHTRRECSD